MICLMDAVQAWAEENNIAVYRSDKVDSSGEYWLNLYPNGVHNSPYATIYNTGRLDRGTIPLSTNWLVPAKPNFFDELETLLDELKK